MKLNLFNLSAVILIIFVLFNTYLIYKDHKKTNEIKTPVEINMPFKMKVLKRRINILKKMNDKLHQIYNLADNKNIIIEDIFCEALNQPNKLIAIFYNFSNTGYAANFAHQLRYYKKNGENIARPITNFSSDIARHITNYNDIIENNNSYDTTFKNFLELSAKYSFIANLIQHIVKHPVENQNYQNLIIELSNNDFFSVFDL